MSKNILLLAAIGAAVFLVIQKQAQASGMTVAQKQAGGLIYTPAQTQSANVNGDMWTRLLGDGWRSLVGAQTQDGGPAFIMKNSFGQVVTGDGKPVDGGDPMGAFSRMIMGMPPPDQVDYLGSIENYQTGYPYIPPWGSY